MAYDRSEFAASVTDLRDKRLQAQLPLIALLQRAAPVMLDMQTSSGSWNHFLTILQGFGERVTAARDAAQIRLCAPDLWDDGALRKLKADVLACNAQIDLLAYVMAIPKALIDGGHDASEIIAKFEAKHAESAGQAEP